MSPVVPLLIVVVGIVCIFGYIIYRASGGNWDAESPAPDPAAEPVREPWEQSSW